MARSKSQANKHNLRGDRLQNVRPLRDNVTGLSKTRWSEIRVDRERIGGNGAKKYYSEYPLGNEQPRNSTDTTRPTLRFPFCRAFSTISPADRYNNRILCGLARCERRQNSRQRRFRRGNKIRSRVSPRDFQRFHWTNVFYFRIEMVYSIFRIVNRRFETTFCLNE